MEILFSWLKEYLELEGELSARECAEILTNLGLEASVRSRIPDSLLQRLDEKIVIARIEKIEKHPGADKLLYCYVKPSPDSEALGIVCGAHNIKEGDMVPLALVGARLPGGMEIKKAKIRGKVSQGMLCSERELALGEDHSGIMILPREALWGEELKEWLLEQEPVLELDLTPNRGDWLSVIGVARELGAYLGCKVKLPEIKLEEKEPAIGEKAEVVIEDYQGCPRYVARLIEGIKIAPSPKWMQERLEASGIRAINNVVDITNYVMLEFGQPLHAFDFDLLRKNKIVVRRAKEGEKFTTLDGVERILSSSVLLICDGVGPVAVAGIMGGENSEVRQETSRVLIESAFFDPTIIRRGASLLGMQTEASKRFERRVDPLGTARACDRAVQLMTELCGGEVRAGRLDVYERLLEPEPINFRLAQIPRLLGFDVEKSKVITYFKNLGMEVEEKSSQELKVTPPGFRGDIKEEIDLIEEVARLYGYEKITPQMPEFQMAPLIRSKKDDFRSQLRRLLEHLGFSEVVNLNFQSPKVLEWLDPENKLPSPVKIQNPLGEDTSLLRISLIPALISNLAFNLARQKELVKIFELNKVFFPAKEGEELLDEREKLAGLIARREPKQLWKLQDPEQGFYELKRAVELVLDQLHFPGARIEPSSDVPYLLPGKTARIMLGKERAGELGELDPKILERYDISVRAFVFEIDFELLVKYQRELGKVELPSRYPASYRDISFLVDEEVYHQQVLNAIRQVHSDLIVSVELFDIYRGSKLPSGKKSMTYRLWYQSWERTLTDEEINALHRKVAMKLKEKLGAEIR